MKNIFGNSISVTLFGESHGEQIGIVIDGLSSGMEVDKEFIKKQLSLRRPVGKISTERIEQDNFKIVSGVINDKTTGTPLTIIIENANTQSEDYSKMAEVARPSHADFTANKKYHGFQDSRGGGHFSGRITAPITAAGAILIRALNKKGIYIGTHIKSCKDINDRDFKEYEKDIEYLNNIKFAVLDKEKEHQITKLIVEAKENGDSIGGILETAIIGVPYGVGEPWFDTFESMFSHAIFSIPAVKGIEFGAGFDITKMYGSEANDEFYYDNGKVKTFTNNSGGINGGISNGMPIIIRSAIKPTATIFKKQRSINFVTKENVTFIPKGRHDPCIVHRARVVLDSMVAIVLADMLTTKFGTDYLGGEKK